MPRSKTNKVLAFAGLLQGVFAAPQVTPTATTPAITASATATATAVATAALSPTAIPSPTDVPNLTTVATAVPSPTSSLGASLPSQAPLPPKQEWCPSEIFCAGSLLQTINIARPFADQKTIVDKPTRKSSQAVLSDFKAINIPGVTVGGVIDFLNADFKGEGQELKPQALANINPNPAYVENVADSNVRAWTREVHGYWASLIRTTNKAQLCQSGECESTLIPLNHTFVVPGGRFREQYYWDSFWIIEGLIASELLDVAKDTLNNFMDELETYGFIPNGGRIYYLNRSQPPMFIHMLSRYVEASGDKDILTRALPLAEKELKWWADNRSVKVTSPFSQNVYTMHRYAVTNTAPRPESYLADYLTAHDPELKTPLTDDELADLYSNLASGAESGWDFSSRFLKQVLPGNAGLRTLNVKNTVPIDLNSILYNAHRLLAGLYGTDRQGAQAHLDRASALRAGIIDLFWDSSKFAFYDFELTSGSRNKLFSAATFYPFWVGIIPDEVLASERNAFRAFGALNMVMNRYNGTLPSTFIVSGLQWDAPNAWPPHQYIALEALRNLPSNVTKGPIPTPASGQSSFDLIPSGQLGLDENALPAQLIVSGKGIKPVKAPNSGPSADVSRLDKGVLNGGAPPTPSEGWATTLQNQLVNRYMTSAYCSWLNTGGSIPGVIQRLESDELKLTASETNTGNMFEKFSLVDVGSAGRGGEYTVQAGFGWTNGVVGWIASNYGKVLANPVCHPPSWSVEAQPVAKSG